MTQAGSEQVAKRKWWPWALAGAVVVMLGCGFMTLVTGGVASWFAWQRFGQGPDHLAMAPGEVFLEPASDVGPDPFSAQPMAPPPDPALASPVVDENARVEPQSASPIQASNGAQPGLYGGTKDNTRCDTKQMIDFLAANPAKAAAWVGAQNADPALKIFTASASRPAAAAQTGARNDFAASWSAPSMLLGSLAAGGLRALAPSKTALQDPAPTGRPGPLTAQELSAYIGGLTPLVLLQDTRVTNHSFKDGKAVPRQSVLQKGSAVLVDRLGVPRARCYCGNPLVPAEAANVPPVYVGKSWQGFKQPGVISPSNRPVTVFVVVDPNTGKNVNQSPGTSPPGASAAATNTSVPPAGATNTSAPAAAATNTNAPQGAATETTAPPAVTPTVAPPATETVAPPPATETVAPPPATETVAPPPATETVAPPPGDPALVTVEFWNTCSDPMDVYWIDDTGTPEFRFTLGPNDRVSQPTFPGHKWQILNATNGASQGTHTVPQSDTSIPLCG